MSNIPPNMMMQNALNEAFGQVIVQAMAPLVKQLEVMNIRLARIEEVSTQVATALDKAKANGGYLGKMLSG